MNSQEREEFRRWMADRAAQQDLDRLRDMWKQAHPPNPTVKERVDAQEKEIQRLVEALRQLTDIVKDMKAKQDGES